MNNNNDIYNKFPENYMLILEFNILNLKTLMLTLGLDVSNIPDASSIYQSFKKKYDGKLRLLSNNLSYKPKITRKGRNILLWLLLLRKDVLIQIILFPLNIICKINHWVPYLLRFSTNNIILHYYIYSLVNKLCLTLIFAFLYPFIVLISFKYLTNKHLIVLFYNELSLLTVIINYIFHRSGLTSMYTKYYKGLGYFTFDNITCTETFYPFIIIKSNLYRTTWKISLNDAGNIRIKFLCYYLYDFLLSTKVKSIKIKYYLCSNNSYHAREFELVSRKFELNNDNTYLIKQMLQQLRAVYFSIYCCDIYDDIQKEFFLIELFTFEKLVYLKPLSIPKLLVKKQMPKKEVNDLVNIYDFKILD